MKQSSMCTFGTGGAVVRSELAPHWTMQFPTVERSSSDTSVEATMVPWNSNNCGKPLWESGDGLTPSNWTMSAVA